MKKRKDLDENDEWASARLVRTAYCAFHDGEDTNGMHARRQGMTARVHACRVQVLIVRV